MTNLDLLARTWQRDATGNHRRCQQRADQDIGLQKRVVFLGHQFEPQQSQ